LSDALSSFVTLAAAKAYIKVYLHVRLDGAYMHCVFKVYRLALADKNADNSGFVRNRIFCEKDWQIDDENAMQIMC
jgi:hypothetical protein